ncbi:TPA: ABC transporter permease [archaeon]|nr:ABC transporter permease [Candidatus Undinarchaeales archaeon SRR5007147.bin71]
MSIFIGIFLLSSTVSFSEGLRVTLEENMGLFSGVVVVMEEGASMTDPFTSELDESIVGEIEAMADVEMARAFTMEISDAGIIAGMDSDAFDVYGFDVGFSDGEMYNDASDREIVLGSTYAKRHDKAVGDEVIVYNKKYEVVGVLETIGSAGDDSSIFMPLEETQRLSGKEDTVMMISVKSANIDDAENVANQIIDEFDVMALSDKEMMRQIQDLMGTLNIAIYAIGIISSLVAGIVIMNVMFMSVSERTTEIGAMKAIGATNKQVLSEVITESVAMSLIGGTLGVLVSFVLAKSLNIYLDTRLMEVTGRLIMISILYSGFLGALGSFLPARQAMNIDPIEALRYE